MIFKYNDKDYEVEIKKKNNKNTYIRIKNNKIYITTNYFTTKKTLEKLLKENKKNIEIMIDKVKKQEEFKEKFLIFGKSYDIIYNESYKDVILENNLIKCSNEIALSKYLEKYIYTIYLEHLMYWYNKFEEKIPEPNLKIRTMKTRWGVCNRKNNNITLNKELHRYDIECLDYVIIHELSHFIEPNHSKSFWTIVYKYCPNYKELRKKLRS